MKKNIINIGKEVINIENKGLKILAKSINNNFVKAIEILKKTKGRIILTGIGKSGIIANKISSTLSSTGSPSQFIHPAEAGHGDLGILSKNDSIIALTLFINIFSSAKGILLPWCITFFTNNNFFPNSPPGCNE